MQVFNALQLLENRFFVYIHTRPDTNEVFYIGMGSYQKKWKYHRAKTTKNRNIHWNRIVTKNNGIFKVDIVIDEVTQEIAINKEKELIKMYGRRDLNTGTLCNFTDGGEGIFNPTDEIRKKLSEGKLGDKNPQFGKPKTQEWKDSMKQLIGEGNPNYGKTIPDWHKEINRNAQLGRKHSKETIDKRVSKTRGKKRSSSFCIHMKQKALEQSEARRQRAKEQWAKKKAEGYLTLKST